MINSRKYTPINLGEYQVRHAVTIESIPCDKGTVVAKIALFEALRQITENPSLIYCGSFLPDSILIKHDNQKWIIQAEYVEQKEPS